MNRNSELLVKEKGRQSTQDDSFILNPNHSILVPHGFRLTNHQMQWSDSCIRATVQREYISRRFGRG